MDYFVKRIVKKKMPCTCGHCDDIDEIYEALVRGSAWHQLELRRMHDRERKKRDYWTKRDVRERHKERCRDNYWINKEH